MADAADEQEINWKLFSKAVIHQWHHDQFGHMNVRWYAHFFDDAAFFFWPEYGYTLEKMLEQYGLHTVTAKSTTTFISELKAGDLVAIEGAITRVGGKSVTVTLRMRHVFTDEIHATCEIVEVFFDPETRSSAEMPAELKRSLEAQVYGGTR